MQTEKMSGFFDVRKYDKKVERRDRKLIGAGENITFCCSYPIAELPNTFRINGEPDEFAKLYISRAEQQAAEAEKRAAVNDRAALKFKIGGSCKWFDKFGHACARPSNEELDGGQYDVQIDFKRKPRNPDDAKTACGYWVNAIMFRKRDANPFAGQAFEDYAEEAAEPTEELTAEAVTDNGADTEMPF